METGKITEEGIRRVVWVPKKLDKEIEILRRKIGYTRSGFYRYALTRLLEQLLLSKRTKVQLRPWEEIIGTLQTIETNSQTITESKIRGVSVAGYDGSKTIACNGVSYGLHIYADTQSTTTIRLHIGAGWAINDTVSATILYED